MELNSPHLRMKERPSQTPAEYLPPESGPLVASNSKQALTPQSREATAAKGLAQFLGLDPRVALIAIVLDSMLFAGEIASAGIFIVFSILVGIVFGFITYKAQRSWYGDDRDSALIKGLIMGLLTAIPTNLPAFLYVPAGFVGLLKTVRKKK